MQTPLEGDGMTKTADQPAAKYTVDSISILRDCYRLLALVYASKEISRHDPPMAVGPGTASSLLEKRFYGEEVTSLILSVAIRLRIVDDQMKDTDERDSSRLKYLERRDQFGNGSNSVFDPIPGLRFREILNKIIHATSFTPLMDEAQGGHVIDGYNEVIAGQLGTSTPSPTEWIHASGSMQLVGTKSEKAWEHVLDLPQFVSAVVFVLGYNLLKNA